MKRVNAQSEHSGHLSDDDDDDDDDDDVEENEDNESEAGADVVEMYTSSLVFPCPHHAHRDAEQYCLACEELACSKCVTSVHRKCGQQVVTPADAVVTRRPKLNSLHTKLAEKLIRAQDVLTSETSKLQTIESERAALIGQIRAQTEAVVQAILAKERQMVAEVNATLDREKAGIEGRAEASRLETRVAEGQLSVLEAVLSVKGEPEILSLLPGLHSRLDSDDCACASSPRRDTTLVFSPNTSFQKELDKFELGRLALKSRELEKDGRPSADGSDLHLTLMTSFHARSREDTCDPLLTDLVLLPSGDVIITDRDNRCVKKFNATGHLLTRVPIPEVPSRIALVSHGKAAISVMNKRVLFFLSLLGTVRVLSSVRLKKSYCFLAAAGHSFSQGQGQGQSQKDSQGQCQLLAATSQCDVIDLILESGVVLRRLYTHKGERVSISRPLYMHVPASRDPSVAALVVDSGRRMLFALTSDGKTTFTFKPKDENALECPLGVASVASGVILLADRDKHRILLLGRRGTFIRELLGEKEGLHKPCAVCTAQPHRVAITQVDGWVKIYRTD
nr:hypothetical protein BaRGS_034945 [Batillaria attramentaria]